MMTFCLNRRKIYPQRTPKSWTVSPLLAGRRRREAVADLGSQHLLLAHKLIQKLAHVVDHGLACGLALGLARFSAHRIVHRFLSTRLHLLALRECLKRIHPVAEGRSESDRTLLALVVRRESSRNLRVLLNRLLIARL